jgi:RNA 3'-terminal phosphate cyclase (ATP)
MILIDGSYGEGGGQIVRSALTLSIILNRPVSIQNIRAGRKNPGLSAQHLTAVRAAAMICAAQVSGATLGASRLTFAPQGPACPGPYEFDVAEAREGGSAGAATLVLQTVLLPLALAAGESTITVKGGTHVPWSPPFHHLAEVYLPALARLGAPMSAELLAWGWYPAGGGAIRVKIPGQATLKADQVWPERGALRRVTGVAVASSLPADIAQRMSARAMRLLTEAGLPAAIAPQRVRSVSPGAGLFLTAEYEFIRAGFSALGQKGKPADKVAEEAVNDLLAFHRSQAILDDHLADQILLPLALAGFTGQLSAGQLSLHATTNLWVAEQFLGRTLTGISRSEYV